MRVIVADDALLLREGLARLLTEAGHDVVGLAADAEQLLTLVEAQQPDVAIVDIRMPPTHTNEGLHAAREIRARWPKIGIIVLSQYLQPSYAIELLEGDTQGIGYLLKDRLSDLDELSSSVRRVAEGGCVLDPSVVARLVDQRRGDDDPLHELSQREREVLSLMAEGKSNKAIGQSLWITEHTVEKHVNSIFTKLRLHSSPDEHRRVLAVLSYPRNALRREAGKRRWYATWSHDRRMWRSGSSCAVEALHRVERRRADLVLGGVALAVAVDEQDRDAAAIGGDLLVGHLAVDPGVMAVGGAGHCAAVLLDHDAEVVARVTDRWALLRISGFERRKLPGPKDLPAQ